MAFLADESGSFAFVRALKELMTGTTGGSAHLLQKPTVPTTLTYLAVGDIPVHDDGMLRSGLVMMANKGADSATISAGTVVATGLDLKPSKQYACVIWTNVFQENTLKVNDTGKSITFTADISLPASKTCYLWIEETL